MKSDVYTISTEPEALLPLLNETEKVSGYAGLTAKEAGRLRLLAEELVEMLPELLKFSKGEFWIECEGKSFELHTSLTPVESMTAERRTSLLAVSSTGKNIAAKGIMSKIRLAAEFMLIDYDANSTLLPSFYSDGIGTSAVQFAPSWSLSTYKNTASAQKDERWDELEKSIIANIADDVLVGVQGKRVDIIVKKSF